MYEILLEQFESLRHHTARFRRAALHLHSPDSHDWGRGGDSAKNSRELFANEKGHLAFAAQLAPHLDLVAVTDHMRCTFGCTLSGLAAEHGIVVLPGMEVNFR